MYMDIGQTDRCLASDLRKFWGTWWRIFLKHRGKICKVAGSIPDGVTEIFY